MEGGSTPRYTTRTCFPGSFVIFQWEAELNSFVVVIRGTLDVLLNATWTKEFRAMQ